MLKTAPLGRPDWQSLVPHAGSMCLLETVLSWDDRCIHCETTSHRDASNPLRRDGRLSAVHLVEYGAQAMAVHGGLLAQARGERARPGFLVAARDVTLAVDFLEAVMEPLQVRAEMLSAGGDGWMYAFTVAAAARELARGRVSVIHQAAA